MLNIDRVRKIQKGFGGMQAPKISIPPMSLDQFKAVYGNINPSNLMQEYFRYKNSMQNNQIYEPPGGNFTATQPNLQELSNNFTQNNQDQNRFSIPLPDFDAMASTTELIQQGSGQQYDFTLPENFKKGLTWDQGSITTPEQETGGETKTEGNNGPSLKEKLTNFGTKNAGLVKGIGQGADMARGMLFANQAASDSRLTSGINSAYDAISTSLMGFAPVGTVIGGAMKVGALLGDGLQALGGGTDQMTTTDQIMDSSLFSWNIGAINGFAGKRANKFSANRDTIEKVGSSYGGTVKTIEDAASKSGKKYGLFSSGSRRKANRQMSDARYKQNIMTGIADEASDQRAMINDLNYTNYKFNLNGGYDQRYMRAAKSGMKLEDKISLVKQRHTINNFINLDTKEVEWEPVITDIVEEFKEGGAFPHHVDNSSKDYLVWEPIIEDIWEPVITEYIEEFKEGGKTKEELETPEIEETNQKNLIPEGALHKNKHHMEHTEGLTQKGIPVIDNSGEQQAEIELDEIIFTLEVTKKLEELYKEGTDEAAIEAGKLLVKEILFNTDDRTGLIAKCEKGGKLDEKFE